MPSLKYASLDNIRLRATGNAAILILLSLIAVSPRLFFIDVPFERDEGVYAYISDVIDRGGIPYRDAFDHKPPLVYYLYNLSFALFGHTLIAPRLMAIIFTAVTCCFVFLIVQEFTKNKFAGVLAMAFLGLSSSSPAYTGFNSNTEIFTLPFMTAGSYFLLIANRRFHYFLVAGLLFGFAFMVKQVAIIMAFPVCITCLYPFIKERVFLLKAIFTFCSGFFSPFLFFTLYFLANDSFHYFWNDFFIYNISYVNALSLFGALEQLLFAIRNILIVDPVIWLSTVASLLLILGCNSPASCRTFITTLLISSCVAIAAGRYFYGHYFVVILPFLAIAIGIGPSAFQSFAKRSVFQSLLTVAFFASLILFMPFLKMTHQKLLEKIYNGSPFYQSVALGKYLKSIAAPNDNVFILGSEGQILFYSGLASASSIFYFYPLALSSPLQEDFRNQVINDLAKNPPTYLLLVKAKTSFFLNKKDFTSPLWFTIANLLNSYQIIALSEFNSDSVVTDQQQLSKLHSVQAIPESAIVIFKKISVSGN